MERPEEEEPVAPLLVLRAMPDDKIYDEATDVTAEDGQVILDGPDHVDVKITPEAAEKTADNLIEGAMKANGQKRLRDAPHQPLKVSGSEDDA